MAAEPNGAVGLILYGYMTITTQAAALRCNIARDSEHAVLANQRRHTAVATAAYRILQNPTGRGKRSHFDRVGAARRVQTEHRNTCVIGISERRHQSDVRRKRQHALRRGELQCVPDGTHIDQGAPQNLIGSQPEGSGRCGELCSIGCGEFWYW